MTARPIRTDGAGWRIIRVGAVVLLGLGVIAFLTYKVGDTFDLWSRRYAMVAAFPAVTGLSPDAGVTVAGRRAGKVTEIELIPPDQKVDDNNVRVHFWINADAREQVRTDSRARLRLEGLLGDRYLDIEPGSSSAPMIPPGGMVPSVPPVELEKDVLEPLATTLREANIVVAHLHHITSRIVRGEGSLGRLITNDTLYVQLSRASRELTTALDQLNRGDGALGRLLRDPTAYEQLTRALDQLEAVGRAALDGQGTLGRLLTDDELYQRLARVSETADSLMARLGGFSDQLSADGGTLQRLLQDPTLYDQLLKAAVDLQYLISSIREDPRRLRPEVNIDIF